MDIEVFFDPVFHIVVHNMFDEETENRIFEEVIENKDSFEQAKIGKGYSRREKDFRSNTVLYYDEIFRNKRNESVLLEAIEKAFKDKKIREMLNSSPYPLSEFGNTNQHEVQVSRYGDDGQKYKWHIDDGASTGIRKLTMVHYFGEHNYKGGELQFTNSPIYNGKTIIKKPEIKTIKPKNNMTVFFGGNTPHRVMPTKSSKVFEKGRFSVNCWVGYRK